jgi:hypothetical protein
LDLDIDNIRSRTEKFSKFEIRVFFIFFLNKNYFKPFVNVPRQHFYRHLTNFVTPEAKIGQNGQDQKARQTGRKNCPENDVFAMIPAKSGMNSTFFYDKSLNNQRNYL